jgi:hypothetical protein
VPASSELGVGYLHTVRGRLVPDAANLVPLPGTTGWALHSALNPLLPFWGSGELAFVSALPASLTDNQTKLVMSSLKDFSFPGGLSRPWLVLGAVARGRVAVPSARALEIATRRTRPADGSGRPPIRQLCSTRLCSIRPSARGRPRR